MHAWLHADAMPRGHRLPAICTALSCTQAEFYGAVPVAAPRAMPEGDIDEDDDSFVVLTAEEIAEAAEEKRKAEAV